MSAASVSATGHETKPPSRYTEATLIKELEEREIGRPSTYASIIKTITDRGYVYKKGTRPGAGVAGVLGRAAARGALPPADLLRVHRRHGGRPRRDRQGSRRTARPSSREFYFGSDNVKGLHRLVTELGEIDAKEMATFPVGDADSGIVLRVGRYGPYLEGPDDEGNPAGKRANVPEDLPPDELTLEKAKELFANPAGEEIELGVHPDTGLRVVAKNGRFGPYVTEVLPEDAPQVGQAAHGLAVQVDVARHDQPGRRAPAVDAAAGGRHRRRGCRDHGAERSLRPLPEEGHRLPFADLGGAAARRSPSTRRCGSTPSPSSAAGPRRRRRSRSWATTRCPAPRSW